MRQKLRATKSGMGEGSSDGKIALFGQQSTEKKGKKKRDLSDVTCYSCGKKGHLQRYCLTKDEKAKNEKPTTQAKASTSKADKADTPPAKKPASGALYTAMAHATVAAGSGLTDNSTLTQGRLIASFLRKPISVAIESLISLSK